MSWAGVVGQSLAVRLLQQAVASGQLAHAYLFIGPDGVGKRTVALELAKALNCRAPLPDRSACDACPSCQKLLYSPPSHPDVTVIEPDGRFIKTDQMRELQAEMYARPNEGKMRVAIIDGADRLNAEAGNRVLKLLEEPPAYAVFLLLAQNLAGILPTIVSRCQTVNFPPLSPEEVRQVLEDRAGLDRAQARLFAALSGGSIGRAISIAQNPAAAQRRDDTFDFLRKIGEMDDLSLVSYSEGLEKQRDQLDEWLEMMLIWLRDALLMDQTGLGNLVINQDRKEDALQLAHRYGSGHLVAMVDAVSEARSRIQRNANVRLCLDVLLLELSGAARLAEGS